jgi:hypothetical protein
VWLAGPKRARLYLGGQLALLQIAGQELIQLAHAPTLPQAAVLEQLTQKLKARGASLQRLHIDVDLGATLCRGAVLSSTPLQLLGSELPDAIQQELAKQVPWPVQQCQLPSGLHDNSVCPVISQALFRSLQSWADAEHAELNSIQALWTLVTQSQRAQVAEISALALQEPDGVVLFRQAAVTSNLEPAPMWQWLPGTDSPDQDGSARKAIQHYGLDPTKTAHFKFVAQAHAGSEAGLQAWAGHWSPA